MKSSIKYLIPLSLLIGVAVTPTFPFNEVTASETVFADLTSAHETGTTRTTNELRKIADQVLSWDRHATPHEDEGESTTTFFESDTSDESEADEDKTEITKLDQEFFTYVMSKYIKRVRLS